MEEKVTMLVYHDSWLRVFGGTVVLKTELLNSWWKTYGKDREGDNSILNDICDIVIGGIDKDVESIEALHQFPPKCKKERLCFNIYLSNGALLTVGCVNKGDLFEVSIMGKRGRVATHIPQFRNDGQNQGIENRIDWIRKMYNEIKQDSLM
ncbi:MAG: hypothetical protein D6735_08860 [Acidobacteria bacterium]|nr:MAG: hypothetical protein D6735_08860 [Acidobacteriota bacterium]